MPKRDDRCHIGLLGWNLWTVDDVCVLRLLDRATLQDRPNDPFERWRGTVAAGVFDVKSIRYRDAGDQHDPHARDRRSAEGKFGSRGGSDGAGPRRLYAVAKLAALRSFRSALAEPGSICV